MGAMIYSTPDSRFTSQLPKIETIRIHPLTIALKNPFIISKGAHASADLLYLEVRLSNGVIGWGEAAPSPPFNGETQASGHKALRRLIPRLVGKSLESPSLLSEKLKRLLPGPASARTGLEMALWDSWMRTYKIPLREFFGGGRLRVRTDMTVSMVPLEKIEETVEWILSLGIRTLKVKIGRNVEEDLERIRLVQKKAPGLPYYIDANEGYSLAEAKKLIAKLKKLKARPLFFEQPLSRSNWKGMKELSRICPFPIAADESISSLEDVWHLLEKKYAQIVNIKLMKLGLLDSWRTIQLCRRAGVSCMIGAMVESRLATTCAAHLASGTWPTAAIDLDTSFFLSREPLQGPEIQKGGTFDLSSIQSGIGITPVI